MVIVPPPFPSSSVNQYPPVGAPVLNLYSPPLSLALCCAVLNQIRTLSLYLIPPVGVNVNTGLVALLAAKSSVLPLKAFPTSVIPVSYTHLTLPTICSV